MFKDGRPWALAALILIAFLAGIIVVYELREGGRKLFLESQDPEITQTANDEDWYVKKDSVAIRPGDAKPASVDPAGFRLAVWVRGQYRYIVAIVYWVLCSMTLMVLLRLFQFGYRFVGAKKFYPDKEDVGRFSSSKTDKKEILHEFREWVDERQKENKSHLWGIMQRTLATSAIMKDFRTDLIYTYFKREVDTVMEDILPKRLHETVAAASPAVGFFGTLLGMLYIFSTGDIPKGHLASTPEFAVGLRVAIITSLWGLMNLTIAVSVNYFINFIADRRSGRMIDVAADVIEDLEREIEKAGEN